MFKDLTTVDVQSFSPTVALDLQFGRYGVAMARDLEDLHEAFRLRHQVFFGSAPSEGRIDMDVFDMDAEHLLVWDRELDCLAGTYRIRPDSKTREFYAQGEFAMENLLHLPGRKVELGRACVRPEYRNGACVAALWQGLAEVLRSLEAKWVFGCSSIPWGQDLTSELELCESIYRRSLSPEGMRVRPWRVLPELEHLGEGPAPANAPKLPPLLKAYLNLGAWVCGKPAWDPEMNCVDFLTLLDVDLMSARVGRHFGRGQR
jgi:putative hemolysin